jgi:hypothetical protein
MFIPTDVTEALSTLRSNLKVVFGEIQTDTAVRGLERLLSELTNAK